jgi:hypothetical protein
MAVEAPTDIQEDDIPDVSLVNPVLPEPADGDQKPDGEADDKSPKDPAPKEGEDAKPADDDKKPEGDDKAPEASPDGDKKSDEAAKPEDPKQDPKPDDNTPEERARLAKLEFQNRQRVRNSVSQKIDENYAPKTEEDLVEEGLDPRDAQIEAIRQEMAYREQRATIAELNSNLQADAVNVEHDMSVFNPKSTDFDKGFTQQVEDAYKIAARIQTDDNGIVLNAEVPLYQFYKQMYDIYERGSSTGAKQGQQDSLAMLANTEDPGGSSTTGKGAETLEEMEARLANVVIT